MEQNPIVLVIDDEEGLRDMLSFTLGNEGYTVMTAGNGLEGIEKVTGGHVDIVVTDIKMPVMDGLTVLGKIKEIDPKIEVIMVTGNGTMEIAIESLRKGAYDFINKPVNLDELLAVLKKAVEIKRLKSDLVSLKKLDQLKDDFFSMVTHELRTPLTAIGGSVKLLMNNYAVSEAQKKEIFEIMNRNVLKLRGLVDIILDFSKMEAGFWTLKKSDVSAAELMRGSIRQITSLAETDKIQIVRQTDLAGQRFLGEDIILNCDPEQVERVLTNFLSNSIKYTQTGGKIAVWFEKTDEGVRFTVEDNGKGLPKNSVDKVFDKFYRVDNSDTKKEYGLGLGLSISKKIIGLHGGRVWAESEGPGMGSRFIFTLPFKGGTI